MGGASQNFFFRSINDIASDSGLSRPVVITGLKELSKLKLIKTWHAHWENSEGNLSEKRVTIIQVLDI